MMKRSILMLAALLLVTLAIAGCGDAPQPAATPIALTNTPIPATNTPVLPTPTPLPVEEPVAEEEEAVDETLADEAVDEGIAGVWQVTGFAFGNVSALGAEEAEALVGDTALLAEDAMLLNITFGGENCRAALIDVQTVNADGYLLENYRASAESVGVVGESLEIFTTDCEAIPAFETFYRTENRSTLIVNIEGVFFFLMPDEFIGESPQREPIQFAAGETAATVEGAVLRGERMRYIVSAQAGQEMRVTLSSLEDNAVFTIYDPTSSVIPGTEEGNDVTDFTFTLPESGDYVIIVGATRGNATYTLEVEISAL
jgi:hypothetical protein